MNNSNRPAPDSWLALLLLSCLATAGLFYVNVMPALVDGLQEAVGFSVQQAGRIGSFNMYGMAIGSFLMVLNIKRLDWKSASWKLLIAMIAIDSLSATLHSAELFMAVRFVHGLFGGALVSIGFSVIGRTNSPNRTFGVLMLLQSLIAAGGAIALPLMVRKFGLYSLFGTLIGFSLLTLLALHFLPAYRAPVITSRDKSAAPMKLKLLLMVFASVVLFQAANMGLYAYLMDMGKQAGFELSFVSETLAISNIAGMVGAVAIILIGNRLGVFLPIFLGMLITILGVAALFYSEFRWIWFSSILLIMFAWSYVLPCLFGMCSSFDPSGHSTTWVGLASKIGLASGPMIGSFLLVDSSYVLVLTVTLLMFFASAVIAGLPALNLDRSPKLSPLLPTQPAAG
jgi:predicted MFS family arabinose efflux permease